MFLPCKIERLEREDFSKYFRPQGKHGLGNALLEPKLLVMLLSKGPREKTSSAAISRDD